MAKKLLVIDGNSILNRAFYGIKLLTNKTGLFTNAIYGMITIISKHVQSLSPDYCVVAFDLKAPTFRHKMYDGYKANRKGMPEELAVQVPYAKECMSALGYHVVSKEGFEADDILGTLAAKANELGIQAFILTGDRDSLQLITEDTTVLLVKNNDTINFSTEVFKEQYGILPSQFVDVKALMGDSSDNIPGVPGIGEKTALKLISEYTDLDSLYDNYQMSALTASVKKKLEEGKDKAYLSRDLARIKCDVPFEDEFDTYAYDGIKEDELLALFEMLNFNALIQKFGLKRKVEDKAAEESSSCECASEKESNENSKVLEKATVVALSEEKIDIYNRKDTFSVAFDEIDAWKYKAVFSDGIICHDYKRLVKAFKSRGVECPKCLFDTMLAEYVLNSTAKSFELSAICEEYGINYDNELMAIAELCKVLEKNISDDGLGKLLYDIEIPLAEVLADMELVGFKIDASGIQRYGEELKAMAEDLQTRIYSYVGEEFNISSPKQLGEILFEKMGLPKSRKTKIGYSTDAETLQKMINYHPIIEDILDYRQVTKLKSTYADGLTKACDEKGRVHSVFSQTGTATGRLSSSEPNLQNIPVKTEAGRNFRKYFVPENDDYILIDADYSQIELRILAHVSGDETMISSFVSGEDIHTTTAAKVFGISPEDVTSELRKRAKAVNFGIVYGIGEYSLSEDLGISRAQAKNYIESYFEKFPQVYAYLQGIKQTAEQNGFVLTALGRKRWIPEILSSNKNLKHFGERVAMNSPIQGAAADIIKIAMVEISKRLKEEKLDAKLILQVHDELLIEANRSCAKRAFEILTECMESAIELSVPLSIDAHIGKNWYEAK